MDGGLSRCTRVRATTSRNGFAHTHTVTALFWASIGACRCPWSHYHQLGSPAQWCIVFVARQSSCCRRNNLSTFAPSALVLHTYLPTYYLFALYNIHPSIPNTYHTASSIRRIHHTIHPRHILPLSPPKSLIFYSAALCYIFMSSRLLSIYWRHTSIWM